jgi:hypothetical protein
LLHISYIIFHVSYIIDFVSYFVKESVITLANSSDSGRNYFDIQRSEQSCTGSMMPATCCHGWWHAAVGDGTDCIRYNEGESNGGGAVPGRISGEESVACAFPSVWPPMPAAMA